MSREQIVNRLREANFHFIEKTSRVELYREKGGERRRVTVPFRALLQLQTACSILKQAGLTAAQIERFANGCVKTGSH